MSRPTRKVGRLQAGSATLAVVGHSVNRCACLLAAPRFLLYCAALRCITSVCFAVLLRLLLCRRSASSLAVSCGPYLTARVFFYFSFSNHLQTSPHRQNIYSRRDPERASCDERTSRGRMRNCRNRIRGRAIIHSLQRRHILGVSRIRQLHRRQRDSMQEITGHFTTTIRSLTW